MELLSNIRTDLDAFSDGERGALMNHGHSRADAAIRTYAPQLMAIEAPHSLPAVLEEAELGRALRGSDRVLVPFGRF